MDVVPLGAAGSVASGEQSDPVASQSALRISMTPSSTGGSTSANTPVPLPPEVALPSHSILEESSSPVASSSGSFQQTKETEDAADSKCATGQRPPSLSPRRELATSDSSSTQQGTEGAGDNVRKDSGGSTPTHPKRYRACLGCYKAKTKCSGSLSSCTRCSRKGIKCVPREVEKRKRQAPPKKPRSADVHGDHCIAACRDVIELKAKILDLEHKLKACKLELIVSRGGDTRLAEVQLQIAAEVQRETQHILSSGTSRRPHKRRRLSPLGPAPQSPSGASAASIGAAPKLEIPTVGPLWVEAVPSKASTADAPTDGKSRADMNSPIATGSNDNRCSPSASEYTGDTSSPASLLRLVPELGGATTHSAPNYSIEAFLEIHNDQQQHLAHLEAFSGQLQTHANARARGMSHAAVSHSACTHAPPLTMHQLNKQLSEMVKQQLKSDEESPLLLIGDEISEPSLRQRTQCDPFLTNFVSLPTRFGHTGTVPHLNVGMHTPFPAFKTGTAPSYTAADRGSPTCHSNSTLTVNRATSYSFSRPQSQSMSPLGSTTHTSPSSPAIDRAPSNSFSHSVNADRNLQPLNGLKRSQSLHDDSNVSLSRALTGSSVQPPKTLMHSHSVPPFGSTTHTSHSSPAMDRAPSNSFSHSVNADRSMPPLNSLKRSQSLHVDSSMSLSRAWTGSSAEPPDTLARSLSPNTDSNLRSFDFLSTSPSHRRREIFRTCQ